MNGYRKCEIFMYVYWISYNISYIVYNIPHIYNGILLIPKKEGNPAICDNNTKETEVYYAKRNKPDTEIQILYDFT